MMDWDELVKEALGRSGRTAVLTERDKLIGEISFKAGYDYRHIEDLTTQDMLLNALGIRLQERDGGRREVVEWLREWAGLCDDVIQAFTDYQWDKKLKEWGIE